MRAPYAIEPQIRAALIAQRFYLILSCVPLLIGFFVYVSMSGEGWVALVPKLAPVFGTCIASASAGPVIGFFKFLFLEARFRSVDTAWKEIENLSDKELTKQKERISRLEEESWTLFVEGASYGKLTGRSRGIKTRRTSNTGGT